MTTVPYGAGSSYPDYFSIRGKIDGLVVAQLKAALKNINSTLYVGLRMNGVKADLINGIKGELDRYAIVRDTVRYEKVKNALFLAHPSTFRPLMQPPPDAALEAQLSMGGMGVPSFPNSTSTVPAQPSIPPPQPIRPVLASTSTQAAITPTLPSQITSTTPNVEALAINFRPSPFYEFEATIMQPLLCNCTGMGDRKSVHGTFQLKDEHRRKLESSRNSLADPQYQLRLFCTTDDYYNPPHFGHGRYIPGGIQPRGAAPVEFPTACEAKINGQTIGANKLKGIKKREGSTAPPDLDVKVGASSGALDLRLGYTNRLELIYVNTERIHKRFFLLVAMVKVIPVTQLVKELQDGKTKSAEDVVTAIKAQGDSDIAFISSNISLKCPLSMVRLTTPIRSLNCTHLQCFDANNFLSMMEQTPTWNCPVCYQVIKMEDLIFDGYTSAIIAKVPQSVDSVIVEDDGTWHTSDNKFGNSSVMDTKNPVKAETSNPDRRIANANNDIMVLDDDGEFTSVAPTPKVSQTTINLASSSPYTANPHLLPPKSTGPPVVIDLTESDDEEFPALPSTSALQPDGLNPAAGLNAIGLNVNNKRPASGSWTDYHRQKFPFSS